MHAKCFTPNSVSSNEDPMETMRTMARDLSLPRIPLLSFMGFFEHSRHQEEHRLQDRLRISFGSFYRFRVRRRSSSLFDVNRAGVGNHERNDLRGSIEIFGRFDIASDLGVARLDIGSGNNFYRQISFETATRDFQPFAKTIRRHKRGCLKTGATS